MNRRQLLGTGAVAAIAIAAAARSPLFWSDHRRLRRAFDDIFDQHFPRDVARHPDTSAFLDGFAEVAPGATPENAVQAFLVSSNVVAHLETGAALEVGALYDAYDTPCANYLSAGLAPEGEHDV